jgi:hypothetical protein
VLVCVCVLCAYDTGNVVGISLAVIHSFNPYRPCAGFVLEIAGCLYSCQRHQGINNLIANN